MFLVMPILYFNFAVMGAALAEQHLGRPARVAILEYRCGRD